MRLLICLAAGILFFPFFALEARDCSNPFQNKGRVMLSRAFPAPSSAEEIQSQYQSLIDQDLRLEYRGFLQDEHYVLPMVASSARGIPEPQEKVHLPETVIEALGSHFKQALQKGYARNLFFPDMGHGHLQIPYSEWLELSRLNFSETDLLQEVLNSPHLQILYHAAENYDFSELRSVKELRFLGENRNLIGDLRPPYRLTAVALPNNEIGTLRHIDGMVSYKSLYFSVSRKGCLRLPFLEQEGLYLDLALQGLSLDLPKNIRAHGGR